MGDIIRGFRYLLSGFSLIGKPRIRLFVVIPLLVNTLLFAGVIYFGASSMNDFIESLSDKWQFLEWLLWPLFALITMTVVFFGFSILANLIAAPFNGFLAETVEYHLEGKGIPSSSNNLVREIIKALGSEANKFLYFIIRAVPLLILLFIPGLQLLWLLFGAWMMALEYMDYPMGNHGMTFKEERLILKKRRALVLGFGSGVMLMALVPVLNFIVMPVAVCGATRLWLDEFKLSQQSA